MRVYLIFFKRKSNRQLPSDILYEPIDARDSDIFITSHDMIDFNKEELDYLSSISKYHKLETPHHLINPLFLSSSTHVKLFFIQTMNNEFRVLKFNDEWYLIKHKEWVEREFGENDNALTQINNVMWKYYKCDTFDGVKQFFIEQKKLGKLK